MCPICTERVVTGEVQFFTGLPPAVDSCDDGRMKGFVEFGFQLHFSSCCLEEDPIAVLDFTRQCGARVNLEEGIGQRAAQSGNISMLLITEVNIPEKSKDQRIDLLFGGEWVARKAGEWSISGLCKYGGEDLDFAARRFESAQLTAGSIDLGILSMASLNVSSDPMRMLSQLLAAKA